MTALHLIYLCNVFDERTHIERSVTSDSPAATRKVAQVTSALRRSGVGAVVLSLGRGRQQGSGKWYSAKVVREDRTPIIYAPFFDFPILTHLVTLFGLVPLIWRLRSSRGVSSVLLSYNRLPHYLMAVELAKLLKFRCFLDLEDGDVQEGGTAFRRWLARVLSARFDHLCNAGGVLAASALSQQYAGQKTVCCYGVANSVAVDRDWDAKPLVVLLGGTLQRTTGVQIFIEAIRYLRALGQPALRDIEFVITGKGDMAASLQVLSAQDGLPKIKFLGSVSRSNYVKVVQRAHIGIALKLPSSDLAETTFPSKVIEFASTGLLVLSTRVSDVPSLFREDGAIYLNSEDPRELAERLLWLLDNRDSGACIAARGQAYIAEACSSKNVGQCLKMFFFSVEEVSRCNYKGDMQ
jgi:glycosyltransferase involved in cell wall biosynthesis